MYNFVITDSGKLVIQGQKKLSEELMSRKGQRGTLEIRYIEEEVIDSLVGYYRNTLIPEFRKALFESGLILSENQTEHKAWKVSNVTNDLDHTDINKLDRNHIILFIADIKRIAAQDLNYYIN